MLDFIIKNGFVVNADRAEKTDIAVKDGFIVALGDAASFAEAKQIVDAEGMYVFPGMIDSHAHIASTGVEFNSLDDYPSGTVAAAYGGTTTIVDFSFLKEGETPKENAQSNFGCIGNSFTRDDGDGQIVVFMDDEEYHVFKKI